MIIMFIMGLGLAIGVIAILLTGTNKIFVIVYSIAWFYLTKIVQKNSLRRCEYENI